MRGSGQQEPRRYWALVAGAALVQLALFAVALGPGLAGTSDSVLYQHAAGTLRAAGQLLHPDGSAYRFWPPLYPALLALGSSAGAAAVLHAASLLGSLLAWSWLGRQLLPRPAAWVLPWALALSTPWLLVSKFVWGETVFLVLFAGYALALFRWLQRRQMGGLALATGVGFLLPLHRTAGFFLLLGLGLGLLVSQPSFRPKERLLVVGHFLLALTGGIAWHVYALLVAAPSVYRLNRGWAQFFSSAADYGFVLSRWLLPVPAAGRAVLPVGWALALVALLAGLYPRAGHSAAISHSPLPAANSAHFPRLLWGSIVFFILMLLVSTTFTRSAAGLYDAERYASVLFGPVLLLALLRISNALTSSPLPDGLRQWLWRGLVVAGLAYAAGRAGSNALALHQLPALPWPAPMGR